MLRFLQDLDWGTRLNRVRYRDHWRVQNVAVAGALLASAVWHVLFPNTLWFYKLWGAGATGGMLGAVVGYAWQLTEPSRRARSSGRYFALSVIGGIGMLFPLAVFILGPMLHAQERELARIRTLSVTDVSSTSIQAAKQPPVKVVERAAITSFVKQCHASKLFYPSHEPITNKSRLTVHFMDGTARTYEAGIPMRHQADMVLSFPSYVGYSHVLIPNGAKWLELWAGTDGARKEPESVGRLPAENPPQ